VGRVHYHHPGDKQFSIDFVNPEPERIVSQLIKYGSDVAVKVNRYSFDEQFYVVYTSRVGGGPVNEIELNPDEALAEMDSDNGVIVARLLEIYRALISENEAQEEEPVEAYKDVDIEALPDVLDKTRWEGTATEVAGRLASNLILKHALPNANHRTAIALIQFYLSQIDPSFSLPETKVQADPETYDWREWVNEYINESKRLLTVRRKNVLFRHLREFGVTTLERKHGVEIDLERYELDMYPSEAKRVYAEAHEDLWVEFAAEAVERAGNPNLQSAVGPSKSEFAEWIRQLS